MEIIVGTAGHIDHGKTALVRALTGTDTDRLPEEKRRGITVDLGFAELTIGDVHVGFVDVPGHERFVKNMLAGATGIDIVLLVIAADEGVMPQTREHFDIVRLLGIRSGIVVLTKTDLVDEETLELARLEAEELVVGSFLEDAVVVAASAKDNIGIHELKEALSAVASRLDKTRQIDLKAARLAIDRSFTVKGFGAVVTGTLASGSIGEGDEVELLPTRKLLRVRGIQTHGAPVVRAAAGSRTALNLAGVDHSDLHRGMTVTAPGTFEPTRAIDAQIEMLASAARPLKSRQRVRLHIGTDELLARVHVLNNAGEIEAGETGFAQLRLEAESVAAAGDKFILRSYSPQVTIGGGEVLDPLAQKHRKRDFPVVSEHLGALLANRGSHLEQISLFIGAAGRGGLDRREIAARTGFTTDVIEAAVAKAVAKSRVADLGGRLVSREEANALFRDTKSAIYDFHRAHPLEPGMPRTILRGSVFAHLPVEIFEGTLANLERDKAVVRRNETVRLPSHSSTLTPAESAFKSAIVRILVSTGLQPPKINELTGTAGSTAPVPPAAGSRLLSMLVSAGEVVKVSEEFYFSRPAVDALIADLKSFAARSADRLIDMGEFKTLAGVSRKHAIPLSEYLDRERVTVRRGDKRFII